MAVQLGTVAAIGFSEFAPAEWLGCFRRLGCTVVQAYRNLEADVSIEQMKDAIAAGGMACDSLHGVFGEQYDPSAPDERARRRAVDTFKAEGELALQLGGPLLVVHCSTIRKGGVPADQRALRWDQLEKSITELGRFGQDIGVAYAFENLPGYHPVGSDVAELAAVLNRLAVPNTGMCFDTGHANMVGDAVSAIGQTDGQMIYLHLSDNSGQADEHQMPTYGTLDTDGICRQINALGYSGTMMLEVFCSADRLRALIDEGCSERLGELLAAANGRRH